MCLFVFAGCGYRTINIAQETNPDPSNTSVADAAPVDASVAYRDPLQWPFAATSIWNTSIGSDAVFVPANIKGAGHHESSTNFLIQVPPNAPERPLFRPGNRPDDVCTGTTELARIFVPDDFVLSAGQNANPGNAIAFLQPDGHTLVETSGTARCESGGPIFGFPFPSSDLYGDGIQGGQGGSALSALGGALRIGELFSNSPIRHALKVALSGKSYYFYDPANPARCRRWPASRCDRAASESYQGNNPSFAMGALLAIPDRVTLDPNDLETTPGRRMYEALRNYGAYVVGDADKDIYQVIFEAAAGKEFSDRLPMRNGWGRDLNKIFPLLHIVDNNGPDSIGGGGTRKMPPPPPLPPLP